MTAESTRVGFMYAGLPGAGKTTAAQIGSGYTGGEYIETGDIVREAAEQDGIDATDSAALGDYAASERERLGNGFVSQKLVGMLLRGDLEVDWPMHVSGVRHVKGAIELRNYLSTSALVIVEAPFQVRLERLKERAREGEEEFTDIDLLDRDRRELNDLGTETILSSDEADGKIVNDGDLHLLEEKVRGIVDSYGTFD